MAEEPDKISGYVYISPEHDNGGRIKARNQKEQGFAGRNSGVRVVRRYVSIASWKR